MRLITPEQIKAIDRYCSEQAGLSQDELMKRAGKSFFEEINKHILHIRNKRFAVLCGPGNNGGDGMVTAQLLRRAGADVTVWPVSREAADVPDFSRVDVILDCIFGIGFHGRLPEGIAKLADAVNASGKKVFAADIPSGVSGADGSCDPRAIRADYTVAFCGAKPGHALYPGCALCGRLSVYDLDIPSEIQDRFARPVCDYFPDSEQRSLLAAAFPKRQPDTHKGNYGSVGIVAGSKGMCGAAALTAEAALRTGAGLVYSFVPEALLMTMECLLKENVKLPVSDFTRENIDCILDRTDGMEALIIGPGMGNRPETAIFIRQLIERLSESYAGRVLVDADGLNAFEGKEELFSACMKRGDFGSRVLITPHPKELSRLTGESTEMICKNRIQSAVSSADRLGCSVLLKGASTVTAEPGRGYTVNGTGNPGMATAGSGDVLSGIAGALLIRMAPYDAGRYGAYYHGFKGDRAALIHGEYGLLSGDMLI